MDNAERMNRVHEIEQRNFNKLLEERNELRHTVAELVTALRDIEFYTNDPAIRVAAARAIAGVRRSDDRG